MVVHEKRPDDPVEGSAASQKSRKTHASSDAKTHPQDCILQLVTTDHLDRLRAYFDDESIQKILFPAPHPCAASAASVGPPIRRVDTGKSFLQFSDISAAASEWVKWMETSPVRFVITRMFFLDGGERGERQTAGSLDELVEQLTAHAAAHPPPGPVRLQFAPRTMEKVLLDRFEEVEGKDGASLFEFHPVRSKASLHVFQYQDGTFRWSMRPAEDQFYTSPDGPTRIPGSFTKAAAKLAEAILVSGEQVGTSAPQDSNELNKELSHRVAVDVGASPGGWTHHLAVGQGMETVIAIDPAELHESVLALENVHHLRMTSQAAGKEIEQILGERKISVMTCDANQHPDRLAEMLAPVMKYLSVGGLMVLTMKFSVRKRKKQDGSSNMGVESQLQQAFAKQGFVVKDMRSVWLLSNTSFERTVLCRMAAS